MLLADRPAHPEIFPVISLSPAPSSLALLSPPHLPFLYPPPSLHLLTFTTYPSLLSFNFHLHLHLHLPHPSSSPVKLSPLLIVDHLLHHWIKGQLVSCRHLFRVAGATLFLVSLLRLPNLILFPNSTTTLVAAQHLVPQHTLHPTSSDQRDHPVTPRSHSIPPRLCTFLTALFCCYGCQSRLKEAWTLGASLHHPYTLRTDTGTCPEYHLPSTTCTRSRWPLTTPRHRAHCTAWRPIILPRQARCNCHNTRALRTARQVPRPWFQVSKVRGRQDHRRSSWPR